MKTSRVSKFYERSPEERLNFIKEFAELTDAEAETLKNFPSVTDFSEKLIENVIGNFSLPIGVAVNFLINNKDYIIPMVLEEPSVVAAASNSAKLARECGGFKTSADDSIMIGQIHLFGAPGLRGSGAQNENNKSSPTAHCPLPTTLNQEQENVVQHILNMKQELLTIANSKNPTLINLGGGAKDLSVDILPVDPGRRGAVEAPENNESSPTTHCPLPTAQIIRIHLYVDCKDAMGANIVNTMVEAIAPKLEELGGKAVLKIVSNLADRRLARAECVFKKELLSEQTINLIIKANQVAEVDPYRAATHNKGIMNAISAICIATGNDWRAVEAGAHAYASVSGGAGAPGRRGGEVHTLHSTIHTPSYKPLTHYELTGNNDLKASIELPLAVATVGGSTKHPQAQVNLKILGVKSAQELAQVMAAAGLAQNFAALKAITTEGIQKGHMKLHERKK